MRWLRVIISALLIVVAGFIWLPVAVASGELACLIALPLALLAGVLVAWAGPKWTWLQFRLRTLLDPSR
jgi:hypothetical protein